MAGTGGASGNTLRSYALFPSRCFVYPLSGSHDVLSRVLFYLLLIVSLDFRRHVWLSTAALGIPLPQPFHFSRYLRHFAGRT